MRRKLLLVLVSDDGDHRQALTVMVLDNVLLLDDDNLILDFDSEAQNYIYIYIYIYLF